MSIFIFIVGKAFGLGWRSFVLGLVGAVAFVGQAVYAMGGDMSTLAHTVQVICSVGWREVQWGSRSKCRWQCRWVRRY